MGGRTTKELSFYERQLLGLQTRSSSCCRRPVQRPGVPVTPSQPPFTDTLLADPENMSNSRLPLTLLEKRNGFHAPVTQPLEPLLSPLHEGIMHKMEVLVRKLCEAQ